MELAHRAGLKVARVELTQALKKKVLLVERFDRIPGTEQRRSLVSALTMLSLNELPVRTLAYSQGIGSGCGRRSPTRYPR